MNTSNCSKLLAPTESHIRGIVDPEERLPAVSLAVYREEVVPEYFSREKVHILYGGEPVGACNIITEYGQRVHFDLIELFQTVREKQIKGLGLASYVIAAETAHSRGLPFESQDGVLSDRANRVWQILVERGAAYVVQDPRQVPFFERETRYLAKYRTFLR